MYLKYLLIAFIFVSSNAFSSNDKCYENTSIKKTFKNINKLTFSISPKSNGNGHWTKLAFTSNSKGDVRLFNCFDVEGQKGFTCAANDDSGKFSYIFTEKDSTLEMKLRYVVFGGPDDQDNVEINKSNEKKDGLALEFKKVSCK